MTSVSADIKACLSMWSDAWFTVQGWCWPQQLCWFRIQFHIVTGTVSGEYHRQCPVWGLWIHWFK